MADGDITDVFDFWRQCAKHQRAHLDDKRRQVIARAMRWGYTEEDLKLAIYGCCSDPWYGDGQNKNQTVYTHLTLILRDGDHIDKFIKLGDQALRRAHAEALDEHERRRHVRRPIPEQVREKVRGLFAPRPTKT